MSSHRADDDIGRSLGDAHPRSARVGGRAQVGGRTCTGAGAGAGAQVGGSRVRERAGLRAGTEPSTGAAACSRPQGARRAAAETAARRGAFGTCHVTPLRCPHSCSTGRSRCARHAPRESVPVASAVLRSALPRPECAPPRLRQVSVSRARTLGAPSCCPHCRPPRSSATSPRSRSAASTCRSTRWPAPACTSCSRRARRGRDDAEWSGTPDRVALEPIACVVVGSPSSTPSPPGCSWRDGSRSESSSWSVTH